MRIEEMDEQQIWQWQSSVREQWNIPTRHEGRSSFTNEKWKAKLKTVTDLLGTGFICGLVGIRGSGKTQLAVEVMKIRLKMFKWVRFCSAMEFFLKVKSGYGRNEGPSEIAVIQDFVESSLLVIDETQERGSTPWEDRLLTFLVNKRYENGCDTILISNERPEDFAKSIGSSIMSRIIETAGIIHFDWESFRK